MLTDCLKLDVVNDGVVAHPQDAALPRRVELLPFAVLRGGDVHEVSLLARVGGEGEDDRLDGSKGLAWRVGQRVRVVVGGGVGGEMVGGGWWVERGA